MDLLNVDLQSLSLIYWVPVFFLDLDRDFKRVSCANWTDFWLFSFFLQKVKIHELGDTVILNVDQNSVKSEYDDLSSLPEDVVSSVTFVALAYLL